MLKLPASELEKNSRGITRGRKSGQKNFHKNAQPHV